MSTANCPKSSLSPEQTGQSVSEIRSDQINSGTRLKEKPCCERSGTHANEALMTTHASEPQHHMHDGVSCSFTSNGIVLFNAFALLSRSHQRGSHRSENNLAVRGQRLASCSSSRRLSLCSQRLFHVSLMQPRSRSRKTRQLRASRISPHTHPASTNARFLPADATVPSVHLQQTLPFRSASPGGLTARGSSAARCVSPEHTIGQDAVTRTGINSGLAHSPVSQ
ncbi:hypothetical protein Q8A67_025758 [Cirrhinus molitorella]|uniref:Uncharacterized protein n=1 Tax=Cirrhinus molitorella TaxID=172907 RepID=A0AA88T7L9_9TELE|nr:hypothetical protein Q8A67_025758 [Cirrhinus molitorella]